MPAGRLGAALDDVPGDDGTGERVPVVAGPAVVPGGRTAHERGVGDPAGDDDVGTRAQRLDDAEAAEVGVGGEEARRVAQRLTGVEVGEVHAGGLQLGEPREQVVAVDEGDRRRQAQLRGDLARRLRRSASGSRPPAFETTLMPRSRQVPRTCSIWVRKLRA